MFVVVSAVRAGVYGLTLMMPHESMSDHVNRPATPRCFLAISCCPIEFFEANQLNSCPDHRF
jgi:hypothetical protein